MRGVGASPTSTPVLSNNLMVHPGHAYTVAGMGPYKALLVEVLDDRRTTPRGKSLGAGHPGVAEGASRHRHGRAVTRWPATSRSPMSPATGPTGPASWMVHAKGGTEAWSGQVALTPGTIHTLVVLDSSTGLSVTDLTDAAGSTVMPNGGAATGLGGTAPAPGSTPPPWLAALVAGALLILAGGYRLRRVRAVARHAR